MKQENKYQPADYTFLFIQKFLKTIKNRIIIVLPLLAPVQQPSPVTTWKNYDFCTRMSENT